MMGLDSDSDERNDEHEPIRLTELHKKRKEKDQKSIESSHELKQDPELKLPTQTRSRLSALIQREKLVRNQSAITDQVDLKPDTGNRAEERDRHLLSHSRFYRRATAPRSLSPARSSFKNNINHDANSTSNNSNTITEVLQSQLYDHDLIRRLDAGAFHDISQRVSSLCAKLPACPDEVSLRKVFVTAQADLANFGLSQIQLWFLDTEHGTLQSQAGDTLVHISQAHTSAIQLIATQQHGAKALFHKRMGTINSEASHYCAVDAGIGTAGAVTTVRPDEPVWDELEKAMRLVSTETSHANENPAFIALQSRRWYAIHIISPRLDAVEVVTGRPGTYRPQLPFFFVAESLSSPSSIAVTPRMVHSSPAQVKSVFTLECIQRLYSALLLRLAQLDAAARVREHVAVLAVRAAESDTETAQKDCMRAMEAANSMGEIAELLSRVGQQLLEAQARSEGSATAAGTYTWCLLPLAAAVGQPLHHRYVGAHEVTFRVYSGAQQGEYVHTRAMSLGEAQSGLLGRLQVAHPNTAQVLPRVSAGEMAQVGIIAEREHGDAELSDDTPVQHAVRHFTLQALSVPFHSAKAYGLHSLGTAVSLSQEQRGEQCIIVVAGLASQSERCSSVLRSLGELARAGFEALTRRSQNILQDHLRALPGRLLMGQRFEFKHALPEQPLPARIIGASQALARALEESEASQQALAAHSSMLLFSDAYVASLQLQPASREDEISFFHVGNLGLLQTVQPRGLPFIRGTLLWLQHLMDGKPVRFVRETQQNAEDIDDMESLVAKRGREAQAALQQLVLGCIPRAQTAFLLPISTVAGMCVLLAVDTLIPTEPQGPQKASTSLGAADLLTAYESSGLCLGLAAAVNVAHSMHLGQIAACERDRAMKREEGLRNVLFRYRTRQRKHVAFLKWRTLMLIRELHVGQRMLSTAKALMVPQSQPEEGETEVFADVSATSAFMSRVEEQVTAVFHHDSVDVTLGGLPPPANALDLAAGCNVLAGEVDVAGHMRAVLYGVVWDGQSVLACIRVVRTAAGSRGPYPVSLVQQLEQICQFASLAHKSFQQGLMSSRTKGNVPGLLLPILRKLLPILAAQPALPQSQASLRALLEDVATAFKYLCGGDVAIVRLTHAVMGGSAKAFEEASKGVCNVSSEDSAAGSLNSLLLMLPTLNGYIRDESVPFENSTSPNRQFAQLVNKLTNGAGQDAAVLGEIKVLGPQDGAGFSAEQASAAQLLSFAISHILSVAGRYRDMESTATKAHNIALELKTLLTKTNAELQAEQGASAILRKRLSSALGLSMFNAQARDLSTVQELASFVNEALPPILGSTSALLLVHASHIARASDESVQNIEEEGLRVLLPPGAQTSSEAPQFLSFTQLSEIPTYEAVGASGRGQEKILLYLENSRLPFAAILVLRASFLTTDASASVPPSADGSRPWAGVADVLSNALSACIAASMERMTRVRITSRLQLHLQQEQEKLVLMRTAHDRLSTALEQETALKNEYAAQAASLEDSKAYAERILKEKHQEAQQHTEQLQALTASREVQAELQLQQIRAVEKASREMQRELEAQTMHAAQLSTLCDSFAFDPRCHKQSVQQWLEEFVDSRGCMLLLVAQADDGSLTGAREIHGVISAAAEALRTQRSVQFSSTFVPHAPIPAALGTTDPHLQDANEASALTLRQRWLAMRKSGDRASVLCVPNKCISLHAAHDNACYVFIRGARDANDRFTDSDETLLRCAAGLCCRALFRASSRFSFEEIRRMELDLQQERATLAKLRHAALVAEGMQRKPCATTAEFAHEVEVSVTSLLTRGLADPCAIDCMYWYIPAALSGATVELPDLYDALQTERRNRGDAEAVKAVLSTERSIRIAGTMWIPLKNADNKLLALLRCERKLSNVVTDMWTTASLAVNGPTRNTSSTTQLSDLLFTAEEEEAVSLFCGQAVAAYYRIHALADAKSSIKQAGRALSMLEESKTSVDTQLAHVVRVRDSYRGTLTAAADLLAASCAKRVSAEQIMESARRALVSLSGALECYLILPAIDGVFPSGSADFVSDAHTPTSDTLEPLYCLESDRVRPLRVQLEDSDLERAALRAFRPLSVGPGLKTESEEQLHGGHSSASWAVRRLYGRDTDHHAQAAALHATAVPFTLLGGQRAVATIIRHESPRGGFTAADKECVAWLTRVLVYCLDMWIGKGSLHAAVTLADKLSAELTRLRVIEKGASRLESDARLLEHALCQVEAGKDIMLHDVNVPSVNMAESNASEAMPRTTDEAEVVIMHALNTVFVGASVSVVQANEAGQLVGDLVPPAAENGGNEEGKHTDGAPDSLKLLGVVHGTVRSPHAEVSYWIGRKCQISPQTDGNSEGSSGDNCIIVFVAHAAYPSTWLQLSGIEASGTSPHFSSAHMGLRLAVLLRLLEVQAPWRKRLFACQEDAMRLKELARGLMLENTSAREAHKVKLHRQEQALQRQREVIAASLLACRQISAAASAKARVGESLTPGLWLQEELEALRKVVATCSGWEVSLGHLRPAGSHATAGLALTMSNGSGWMFAAEEVETLHLAPAAGREVVLLVSPPSSDDASQLTFDIEQSVRDARALLRHAAEAQLAGLPPPPSVSQDSDDSSTEDKTEIRIVADKPRLRVVTMFSTLFPAGCVLIPLARAELLIALRPRRDAVPGQDLAVDAAGALVAAHYLKDGICAAFEGYIQEANHRAKCEKMEQEYSKFAEQNKKVCQENEHLAMQANTLRARIQRAAADAEGLRVSRIQNRRYERGLADWAEMLRGVNLAGTRLSGGIAVFWGQACKVLISVLSSHVNLRGCGLCVRYNAYAPHATKTDGIDARDERAVDFFSSGYDGTEPGEIDGDIHSDNEFGNKDVSVRGLSALGTAVEKHVLDVLEGKHNDGSRAVYRLSCSSSDKASGAEPSLEEQMWLIPVRSPYGVLAVLRLTVGLQVNVVAERAGSGPAAENSCKNAPATPLPAPHTPGRAKIRFTPDTRMTPVRADVVTPRSVGGSVASPYSVGTVDTVRTDFTEDTGITIAANSAEEAVDAAQNNALNFAEVVAPLLTAAQAIGELQRIGKTCTEQAKQAVGARDALNFQLISVNESAHLQAKLLTELSAFAASVKIDTTADVAPRPGRGEPAVALLTARTLPLGAMMECVGATLGVSLSLIIFDSASNRADGLLESDSAFSSSGSGVGAGAILVEPLPAANGAALGRVNVSVSYEGRSVLALMHDPHSLGATLSDAEQREVHTAAVKLVLPTLVRALSAFLYIFARERTHVRNLQSLTVDIGRLQRDSEHALLALQTEKQKETSAAALASHYGALASVSRQCIAYIGSITLGHGIKAMGTTNGEGVYDLPNLSQTLPLLCARLPGMLHLNCEVSIGAYKERPDSEDIADMFSGSGNLQWFHAAKVEPITEPIAPLLSLKDKAIADNLARACIGRRAPSTVDVSGGVGSTGVRLLSFPLLVPCHEHALGVLQLAFSLQAAGATADANAVRIDEFCELASASIACMLYTDRRAALLNARVTCTENDLETCQVRCQELEGYMHMWQRRADAWSGIATVASTVARHSTSSSANLADLLASEAVAGPLRGTGVSLRVRRAAGSVGNEAIQTEPTNSRCKGDVVRLGDAPGDVSVEVTCSAGINAAPGAGSGAVGIFDAETSLGPIATELVDTLCTVVRSTATAQRSHSTELSCLQLDKEALQQNVQDLDVALSAVREQVLNCQNLIQDAHAQTTAATASLVAFCGPTIREVAVMLEDLSKDRRLHGPATTIAEGTQMDWAWEGLARVADRAMGRIADNGFGYHASLLVRTYDVPRHAESGVQLLSDIHVRMYDLGQGRRREILTIAGQHRSTKAAKLGVLSDPNASSLEKALLVGGIHETKHSMSHLDLVGIDKATMANIMETGGALAKVTVLCLALPDPPKGITAVLRLVYPTAPEQEQETSSVTRPQTPGAAHSGVRGLVLPVFEMLTSLGCSVLHLSEHLAKQDVAVTDAESLVRTAKAEKDLAERHLADSLRMHRVVCREACALLDPPLVGPAGSAPRAVHPASLTPLAASQDACMKLLAMSRTLMQSEGQALLLRDNTSDETTFQVIYSGNGLAYPTVEMGSFGTITGGRVGTSLAEVAMQTHKIVAVDGASEDPRYGAALDGHVAPCVPMAIIPVRGRGSAVIGVLISVRGRAGTPFSPQDLAAAEIAVSHGALSLYWCQGLGALHHVLTKNVNRLQELEKVMLQLRS